MCFDAYEKYEKKNEKAHERESGRGIRITFIVKVLRNLNQTFFLIIVGKVLN